MPSQALAIPISYSICWGDGKDVPVGPEQQVPVNAPRRNAKTHYLQESRDQRDAVHSIHNSIRRLHTPLSAYVA